MTQPDEHCLGDWVWEDCSSLYYADDLCVDWNANQDQFSPYCGWWYINDANDDIEDAWWVTCDEFSTWEECGSDL